MGDYELVCLEGGEKVDEHYTLSCAEGHKGLLRTQYGKKRLDIKDHSGVFKFYDWLPVHSVLKTESCPVAFQNRKMSKELGLNDLWIGFTGYYPERSAKCRACSFKEMEALPTYARLNDCGGGPIVVASAGNTARAFAQTAEDIDAECIVVVPKGSERKVMVTGSKGNTRLYTVDGDYADSINVADRMAAIGGFASEGGARNVARRDGMGTVMLEGAISMGRIPDHYFQAVGSGTGGISAWEASIRLIGDGRFGDRLPRLNLAQNMPFTPMAKAWNAGRRVIESEDIGDPEDVTKTYSNVLTNRKPPYSMKGGVFDAMTACNGRFFEVSNSEAESAERFWMSFENVRPDPAASVALASLIRATNEGLVDRDDHVFLNMTGGGSERVQEDYDMETIEVSAELTKDISDDEIRGVLNV